MPGTLQLVGTIIMVAAIAIRVGERRIVEALEGAGAVDPGSATKLPLTTFVRKWQFRRLLNVGVVGETMDQAQYLKLAEYIAYRRRRRKRALAAVGIIALLAALLYLASGCAGSAAPAATRADSAGVELVTLPAEVIAAAPVWTVDTATPFWTIGGGEDPAQDIDRMSTVGRLANGDIVVGVVRPSEIRIYPIGGGAPRVIARGGNGPGEFQAPTLLGVRGDTLTFWDYSLHRLTKVTSEGSLVQVTSYAALPRNRLTTVAGLLDDGRIVTSGLNWNLLTGIGTEGVRPPQPVYLLHPDGTTADSLAGPPGYKVYEGIVYEGGSSFKTVTSYHLDGGTPVYARGTGYTITLPDTPELRSYDATGALHRIVRPAIAMREVTPEFQDEYITRDSIEMVRRNPVFSPDWVRNYREGRFIDRLAPFERIRGGPDGELWFERSWVSYDPVKEFVIFDSTGMVAGKVTMPMSRTIGWIGTDAVLTTWLDADDVRHLSLHPLHRAQ